MAFGTQADDAANIPISSVYSKENNTFPALQAEPGAYKDANSNQSSAAVMSFLRPLPVQRNHSVTGAGGKTLTCAFSNNNIAGNSIVVALGCGEVDNGSTITLAVTDSQSNTYTSAVKASQSTTLEAAIFYATNIASGANTVTITIAGGSSSNTAIAVEIYEVWGLIAVLEALDQTATGNNAGSTTPATGVMSPVVPNELFIAAISAAGGTITAGTSWTLDSTSLSPTGGNLVSFGVESRLHSVIASLTPSGTLSGSNAWAMAAACFKSIILPVEGSVSIVPTYVEQASLSASSLNADLVPVTDVSAYKFLSLHIKGTWAGTVSFLISNDNVDWSNFVQLNYSGSFSVYTSTSFNGLFAGSVGFRYFRAQATSYSSGTIQGTLELYQTPPPLPAVGSQANIQYIGGSNIFLGSNTMANSLPVTMATDQTPTGIYTRPTTSGGLTNYHLISAASANANNIKASAGQVYGYDIANNNAAWRYVKLHNTSGTPTAGSGVKRTIGVPPGGKATYHTSEGIAFGTGIGITAVANPADSDATAIGANDLTIEIDYI